MWYLPKLFIPLHYIIYIPCRLASQISYPDLANEWFKYVTMMNYRRWNESKRTKRGRPEPLYELIVGGGEGDNRWKGGRRENEWLSIWRQVRPYHICPLALYSKHLKLVNIPRCRVAPWLKPACLLSIPEVRTCRQVFVISPFPSCFKYRKETR